MKINLVKKVGKETVEFEEKEWEEYNIEHYGKNAVWKSGKYSIVAKEKGKTIGILRFSHDAGVVFVKSLVVTKHKQLQGIGRKIMEQLEVEVKKLDCHKIYLYTGEDWEAIHFYEKLGFKKTAHLPNHYMRKNFIEYTKFLEQL